MTVRKIPCGVVLCAFSFPIVAIASPDPVQGDGTGYWSSGLLIGKKGSLFNHGCLVRTDETHFKLGNTPASLKNGHITQDFGASIYDKNVLRILEEKSPDDVVILSYVHQHLLNFFHWSHSKYFISAVQTPDADFEKTQSGSNHGNEFNETSSRCGRLEDGKKYGTIIHVTRWGSNFFGKVCTLWLQESGLTGETRRGYTLGIGRNINPDANGTGIVPIFSVSSLPVSCPTISKLNIYSEQGCLFAEDALRSMVPVSVKYSRSLLDIWNWHTTIVHNITVRGRGSSVPDPGDYDPDNKAATSTKGGESSRIMRNRMMGDGPAEVQNMQASQNNECIPGGDFGQAQLKKGL